MKTTVLARGIAPALLLVDAPLIAMAETTIQGRSSTVHFYNMDKNSHHLEKLKSLLSGFIWANKKQDSSKHEQITPTHRHLKHYLSQSSPNDYFGYNFSFEQSTQKAKSLVFHFINPNKEVE